MKKLAFESQEVREARKASEVRETQGVHEVQGVHEAQGTREARKAREAQRLQEAREVAKAPESQDGNEVDLIGMAYQNARSESVSLRSGGAKYLKVIAPAKVNLYLAVGAKQENGYHAVENIMHTLLAHDVLYMRCLPAQAYAYETGVPAASLRGAGLQIHLTCSGVGSVEPPDIPAEKNIVYKALRALASALGRNEDEVMDVHLEKHLPHQAGLGGGSSDAAAALVGAAKLWGVGVSDVGNADGVGGACGTCGARGVAGASAAKGTAGANGVGTASGESSAAIAGAACAGGELVERVSKTLGADVAFFLRGGCALYEGAGEIFARSLTTRKDPVVLIKPQGGLSTAAVYSAFDKAPTFAPEPVQSAALQAQAAEDVPFFNGLQQAAESLDGTDGALASVRAWAQAQPGVTRAMLTGSGSCTFAICENGAAARTLAVAAQAQGWWAASTYFANVRAAAGK